MSINKFYDLYKNELILPDKYKNLSINEKCEYIQCHIPMVQGKKYFKISQFNQFLREIINEHLAEKNMKTDPLPFSISNVNNYFYFDIDYETINMEESEIEDFNNIVLTNLTQIITTTISDAEINLLLGFVPVEFNGKGGIHIFVFTKKHYSISEREIIYLKVQQQFKTNKDILNKYEEFKNHFVHGDSALELVNMLDEQPYNTKHAQLIPFAKKSKDSRDYKLKKAIKVKKINDVVLVPTIPIDLIEDDTVHYETSNVNDINNSGEWITKGVPFNKINKKVSQLIREKLTFHGIHNGDILDLTMFFFNFFNGCSTLCDSHPIVKMFKKGTMLWDSVKLSTIKSNSANEFLKCFIKVYTSLMFIILGNLPKNINEFLLDITMILLDPLYVRGGKTHREDVELQIKNCINFMLEKSAISSKFSEENEDCYKEFMEIKLRKGGEAAWIKNRIDMKKETDDSFLKDGDIRKIAKKRVAENDEFKDYNKTSDTYKNAIEEEFERLKEENDKKQHQLTRDYDEEARAELDEIKKKHKEIDVYVSRSLAEWADYIKGIMRNITYEIEPFKENEFSRDSTKFNFIDLKKSRHYYDEQLINLNQMFLLAYVIDIGFKSISRIYESIIEAYTKMYVYKSNLENIVMYIYNVRQTPELERYPYNQWIEDKNNLEKWIGVIFEKTLMPLHSNIVYNKQGGINFMLRLLVDEHGYIAKKTRDKKAIDNLDIPNNITAFTKQVAKNTVEYYKSNSFDNDFEQPPQIYESNNSNYFAMRDGVIEYVELNGNYTVRFHTNNRDKIINSHSLIKYNSAVPKDDPRRAELDDVISKIYPIKEEKEYILNMFSSTICPLIFKDQFMFMYGGGADAKSTFNKIMSAMLGDKVCDNYKENGLDIQLINPHGYAGSIESSTLTHSKQRGTPDEAGTINLKDKTFVKAQEPQNATIQTEIIKDWTSGGVSHGRRIHQHDEEFNVNSLIVCETNILPTYDQVDDAVRRRIVIFAHNAKFVMASNRANYKYRQFVNDADPEKIKKICKNVEYWEILFQILLEHAMALLSKGIKQLSNIVKPPRIQNATEKSFGKTSTLASWFDKNVIASAGKCILIKDLITKIKEANRKCDINEKLINARYDKQVRDEIVKNIAAAYESTIFQLKEDYGTVKNDNWRPDMDKIYGLVESINTGKMTIKEFRDKHVEHDGYSVNSINDTRTLDWSDLILIDYELYEEEDI